MADEKAKIDWKMLETSAAEPAQAEPRHAEPHPAEPAGKIVFHCSNGHRIVVSAKMGGQRGKCSKCGVAVRIPATSESAVAPPLAAAGHAGGAGGEAAAEPAVPEEAVHASARDERLGTGSTHQAHDQDDAHAVGHSTPRDDMFSGLVTASDSQVSATEFVGFSSHPPQPDAARSEPDPGGPEGLANPTAALVARLFQEIAHGGIVEVHITGGSVILPEHYEPRWSVGSHGLFASRAADDTVTLTAVAWDSIQKIIVRQVRGLPDGMFE